MDSKPLAPGDRRIDTIVARILVVGVITAASIVLLGGVVFLSRHGGETFDYGTFRGEPASLRAVPGILGGAFTLSGRSLIQLGILLLVATPVVRVLFSVFAFAARKDRTYIVITLFVLTNLLLGLTGFI
jgi:uncharacterized membrane protein